MPDRMTFALLQLSRRADELLLARVLPWLFVALVVALLIFIVIASWRAAQPYMIEGYTTLDPEETRDWIMETYAHGGWQGTPIGRNRAVFTGTRSAGVGPTILLALFWPFLAIVHWITGRRRLTAELTIMSRRGGGSVVMIQGNLMGHGGIQIASYAIRNLPKA